MPCNGGNPAALASAITSKPKGGRVGSGQQEFLLPPPPIFNQTALPSNNPGLIYSLMDATVSSPSVLVQTLPGSFPDIYDGDTKKWEEHFHSTQRAYKEFGKDDDLAIRVLTEDFTLPFPFTWPAEGEASLQPSYDPTDCSSFDFFLHPGKPVPRILQPLHATTQAFFKKRRLEQLALSYTSQASQGPPAQGADRRCDDHQPAACEHLHHSWRTHLPPKGCQRPEEHPACPCGSLQSCPTTARKSWVPCPNHFPFKPSVMLQMCMNPNAAHLNTPDVYETSTHPMYSHGWL
ncbi:unnamed protein product [Natator depressus]